MTGEARPRALARLVGPQPAPLRRLPRARRHRRAVPRRRRVVGLHRAARRAAVAGPDGQGRRLQGHLRCARPPRSAATARAPARRSRSAPCCDVAADGETLHAAPGAQLLPATADPSKGADLALLRGRGDQRGRRPLGPAPRLLAGGAARPRLARDSRSRAPTASSPSSPPPGAGDRDPRRWPSCIASDPPPAGVPRDRVAAGHLDLDRRGDRGLRRAARGLAVAGGPAAPGALASTRPASAASSRAPELDVEIQRNLSSWLGCPAMEYGLALIVWPPWLLLLSLALCARRATEERREHGAHRGARGRQGGQVPRDPRRRARSGDGQAVSRRTGAPSTATCAGRRSRSCASSTASRGGSPARTCPRSSAG